jgi:hypothetical protein
LSIKRNIIEKLNIKTKKMKKIKMSVAALLIAGMSYGQVNTKSVVLPEYQVFEMLNTIDEILEWQQQDIEKAQDNGEDCSCGSYEEGWGSNYWLTLMREELIIAVRSSRLK